MRSRSAGFSAKRILRQLRRDVRPICRATELNCVDQEKLDTMKRMNESGFTPAAAGDNHSVRKLGGLLPIDTLTGKATQSDYETFGGYSLCRLF